MYIELTTDDLKTLLTEKFGEAAFKVIYQEPLEVWKKRTGRSMSDFQSKEQMDKECPMEHFTLLL